MFGVKRTDDTVSNDTFQNIIFNGISLPVEMVVHILSFVNIPNLANCARLSKSWKVIIYDCVTIDYFSLFYEQRRKCGEKNTNLSPLGPPHYTIDPLLNSQLAPYARLVPFHALAPIQKTKIRRNPELSSYFFPPSIYTSVIAKEENEVVLTKNENGSQKNFKFEEPITQCITLNRKTGLFIVLSGEDNFTLISHEPEVRREDFCLSALLDFNSSTSEETIGIRLPPINKRKRFLGKITDVTLLSKNTLFLKTPDRVFTFDIETKKITDELLGIEIIARGALLIAKAYLPLAEGRRHDLTIYEFNHTSKKYVEIVGCFIRTLADLLKSHNKALPLRIVVDSAQRFLGRVFRFSQQPGLERYFGGIANASILDDTHIAILTDSSFLQSVDKRSPPLYNISIGVAPIKQYH